MSNIILVKHWEVIKMQHKKVSLLKMIHGKHCRFDMTCATIKYGKYLVIKPEGIWHYGKHPEEAVCLKIIVTLHHKNGNACEYQFTNSEIAKLLSGKRVTKKSRGHIINFEFSPFAKYENQKRPTTGKLIASLSMDDPEERRKWDRFVADAQFDQGVGSSGLVG